MNNLEKILKEYENGDFKPLFSVFHQEGNGTYNCAHCPARDKCLDIEGGCAEVRARWLLAEYVEPDSWERVKADALRDDTDYWGCAGVDCNKCPAIVNGVTPQDRYFVYSCEAAQALDIVRRIQRLAASEGASSGEE